jgi:hypothetical protein
MSKFKPGESGNPQGRKPGSKNKATGLRDGIARDLPEIISALTEQAKAGDVSAAKLLLDRALPALRPVDVPVSLALGDGTNDLAGVSQAVLRGLVQGALSPDQCGSVAGVLSALARVKETAELEARITALEESANAQHP